jgi:hypothetical protein
MTNSSADQRTEQGFEKLIRRALATPPISNKEIERRSKEQHKRA